MDREYNPLDAAAVALAALPDDMRATLGQDDVLRILYQEFVFFQTGDHTAPTVGARGSTADLELLVAFIAGAAVDTGYRYTAAQIAHVLAGEDVYLRRIGLI